MCTMAFLKKLAFWKHESEFEEQPSLPPQSPETKSFPSRFSPLSEQGLEPQFSPQLSQPLPLQSLQQSMPDPELRVISAKLDAIKAVLDLVNQRLDRLEKGKSDELNRWR